MQRNCTHCGTPLPQAEAGRGPRTIPCPHCGRQQTVGPRAEGSGLIDLRAVAAAVLPHHETRRPTRELTFAPLPGPQPLTPTPVLMPVRGSGRPAWLLPSVIGGCSLLLATLVLLTALLVGSTGESEAHAAPGRIAGVHTPAEPAISPRSDSVRGETQRVVPAPTPEKPALRRSRRSRRPETPTIEKRRDPKPTPQAEPVKTPVQKMLEKIAKRPMATARAERDAALPARPSRHAIRRSIQRVRSRVQACASRYRVAAHLRVHVVIQGSTGAPVVVRVKGKHSATPLGRCVARALRQARFAPFRESRFGFTVPFILR